MPFHLVFKKKKIIGIFLQLTGILTFFDSEILYRDINKVSIIEVSGR